MDQQAIRHYVAETFPGVEVLTPTDGPGAGDTFFMYDPDRNLDPRSKFPFATIVTKDYGEFDHASQLDRPDVFRLNVGVSRDTYQSLFGPLPAPPPSGETVATGHDFAALDELLPHPVYAPQAWVCVLNPSEATFERVQPLLAEAYERAVRRHGTGRRDDGA